MRGAARLVLLAALAAGGCATTRAASCPCRVTEKPSTRTPSIAWHLFDVTVIEPAGKALNPLRWGRRPAPCNLAGERVPDSTFFTNRDIAALTPDAVRWGPTPPGDAPQPPYRVLKMKREGKTAGCFIEDARGARYLFKLDHPDYPELLTGAEAVSSKLMHALGYTVPSYEIVSAGIGEFVPSRRVSDEEWRSLLTAHAQEGRLRVCASRFVVGDILGPFSFKRYRRCAELRALRLAYAWLNNTDAKDHNTLMTWADGRPHGYLIDFGTSLGANAERGAKTPCQGWVYDVDIADWTKELLTLTLHDSGCDRRETSFSPAVGRFAPRFDPRRWKAYTPNVAFGDLTAPEARWMARRIAAISREQIEAAVSAGHYQRPEDAGRIVEVLLARQQAIRDAYLRDE